MATVKVIAIYISLTIIICTVLGVTTWGIYRIIVQNDSPLPTNPPVTTQSPTKLPTGPPVTLPPVTTAPTNTPIVDATPYCGPGTKPLKNGSTGIATECVINPIPLSEFSPTIEKLISDKKILPVRTENVQVKPVYIEKMQSVIPNTPKEPVKRWYSQWLESGGETCNKMISYNEIGVGCACGDCAGWRGGTAINCSGSSIEDADFDHRVYCLSIQNNSQCACAKGYCPMGGLCVHPFKPRVPGGAIGCPSCITKPKSQGGCAGMIVCDPNEPLIENLVEYPGKRYECKTSQLNTDYFYAQNELTFTSREEMDASCTESDEYRGVNEYECAYECIRTYNNQEDCSKKCLPKLYTWGKVVLNGELQGYYQLPKLVQYGNECTTEYCKKAATTPRYLSAGLSINAKVVLTGQVNDLSTWVILGLGNSVVSIRNVAYGTTLKCRTDDLLDDEDKGMEDKGKAYVCCDGSDSSELCKGVVNCPTGSTTYGDRWKLVKLENVNALLGSPDSLYNIVSELTGFKLWANENGISASRRDYPGLGNSVDVFRLLYIGDGIYNIQAFVPSYQLTSCPEGKCVEKIDPPDLSVLNKCQDCRDCNWIYNPTIYGYQYICETCENCGQGVVNSMEKKCGGKKCKGCTDSSLYFQGGKAGAYCEYCTETDEGCIVYNTNSVGDDQYNQLGNYNPSKSNVPRSNSVVCANYQKQTTCNGINVPENPGNLDGGSIFSFGIDWLVNDKGECNKEVSVCAVRT